MVADLVHRRVAVIAAIWAWQYLLGESTPCRVPWIKWGLKFLTFLLEGGARY